ncbi:hypothetical protein [Arthrobacter globiformis]|uniref:hypothetical protein n=1 Tax=Arthrobacter globiformis TaxID=1665 RepID=UPI0027855363|nr:hypothetical protein [Arthrobacter globiformis]MDQ0866932.1 hypothetical protein [Arthrobacter globiformis]
MPRSLRPTAWNCCSLPRHGPGRVCFWSLRTRPTAATGASGLVLDTGANNERSQQLYRRFGFVRRPERERPRPAPKVQLVVYTLDLAGYQAA